VDVHLANLSFTNLYGMEGKQLTPNMIEVNAYSKGPEYYFPELHLCRWFRNRGEDISVHCFFRTGVAPIIEAYKALAGDLDIDAVVLVDGGTDSLARGDEAGLGTPQEDMASLAAANELEVKTKVLACIGFGVDAFHGVCHAQFLEAVASLAKEGGFLGVFSLLKDMEEVQLYKDAVEFAFAAMPHHQSIVCASVVSAIDGEYGDFHRTPRTAGSKLWINPLMAVYWGFDLPSVARRCLYLDKIKTTNTYQELTLAIWGFREDLDGAKSWEDIPV
jgi:hypothetical protein